MKTVADYEAELDRIKIVWRWGETRRFVSNRRKIERRKWLIDKIGAIKTKGNTMNTSKFFKTNDERDAYCRKLCDSSQVKRGKEGHEYWREFGEVRHIYAFLMKTGERIRLIGERQSPVFFSKEGLNRRVSA